MGGGKKSQSFNISIHCHNHLTLSLQHRLLIQFLFRRLRMLRSLWHGSGRSRLLLRRSRDLWQVSLWASMVMVVMAVVMVVMVLDLVHMVEVRAYSWVHGI